MDRIEVNEYDLRKYPIMTGFIILVFLAMVGFLATAIGALIYTLFPWSLFIIPFVALCWGIGKLTVWIDKR